MSRGGQIYNGGDVVVLVVSLIVAVNKVLAAFVVIVVSLMTRS